jgi:hypothetical protein
MDGVGKERGETGKKGGGGEGGSLYLYINGKQAGELSYRERSEDDNNPLPN